LTPLEAALAVAIGGFVGFVGHELTHYIVARMFGRSASIHWGSVDVAWRNESRHADRVDGLIGGAPVLLGILAFVPLAYALTRVSGAYALSMWVAWVWYTAYIPRLPIGASWADIEYLRLFLLGKRPGFESSEEHQGVET